MDVQQQSQPSSSSSPGGGGGGGGAKQKEVVSPDHHHHHHHHPQGNAKAGASGTFFGKHRMAAAITNLHSQINILQVRFHQYIYIYTHTHRHFKWGIRIFVYD
jgi:hypothetical protein